MVLREDDCEGAGIWVYTMNVVEYLWLEDTEFFAWSEATLEVIFEVEVDEVDHVYDGVEHVWTEIVDGITYTYYAYYCTSCCKLYVVNVEASGI